MIERKFVKDKLREFTIHEFITKLVPGAGHSKTKIKRTPLGDKVIITAAKPGLVVGKKGSNIRELSSSLKSNFKLENPQVEISELSSPMLDARVVCERIVRSLERFGSSRFKRIGHSTLEAVMNAGALGIEIHMSGRIPGSRAKSWRFFQGYIKKSGSTSQHDVDKAIQNAQLKSGVVGVQVKIMPPTIKLPDSIILYGEEISETEMRVEAAKAGGAALPKVEGEVEEDLGLATEATDELLEEVEETEEKAEDKKKKKPTKKKTAQSPKKADKTLEAKPADAKVEETKPVESKPAEAEEKKEELKEEVKE